MPTLRFEKKLPFRRIFVAGVIGALCMSAAGAARAESDAGVSLAASHAGAKLERYAVLIGRGDDSAAGYRIGGAGIYLGHGKILTAAHVVGRLTQSVFVIVDKKPLAAQILKRGAYEDVDVTLLSVETPSLPRALRDLAPLQLCVDAPIPGEQVTVVAPGNVEDSVIVPASVLPPELAGTLTTLIRDVYTTGNSGAGVFDPELDCLMGIMSRKIERDYRQDVNGVSTPMKAGIAKYFVPASQIRAFLGPLP